MSSGPLPPPKNGQKPLEKVSQTVQGINKLHKAFQEPGNLVGLAASAAASLAMLNPVPLLAGAVLEAAYLLFVPESSWYLQRLQKIQQGRAAVPAVSPEQRAQGRAQTLMTLPPETQARFRRLEQKRGQIAAQAQTHETWYADILAKLEYLLDQFLSFAVRQTQFRAYLGSVRQETGAGQNLDGPMGGPAMEKWVRQSVTDIQAFYVREQGHVEELLKNETEDSTRAVLQKRHDVLNRRADYIGRIGKTLTNLNYQLQLVEDTFGLINDEIRARPPEQVLSEIDEVVTQTDLMTKTLDELAPFEQLLSGRG